jgi:cation:H+ antiporter
MVRGVSGLGQRLGLAPFTAGLLLLSVATSLPQLAVNAYAFEHGQVDLALGNAIGSTIASLGLTLALAAIAAPLLMRMRALVVEATFVLVATGAVLLFGIDGEIARWEGALLLLGFAGFIGFVFTRGRNEAAEVQEELAKFAHTSTGLVQNLLRIVIGGTVLFFGSQNVVTYAPLIGQGLGVGALLSGLTLVAVGTALPMLVTVLLAARQGQGNVIAGQVLAACLFNLLLVVGGMAAINPLTIPTSLVSFALPAAMVFVLTLYPVVAGNLPIHRRVGGIQLAMFVAWLTFELAPAWR